MKFTRLGNPELILVQPEIHADPRGHFAETWRADKFADEGLPTTFVQDNHSRSHQGVLRGLHYQIKRPQGKLVRVDAGEVFDVAVDLRRSSRYFGKATTAILSADNRRALWVPPGFAHGFYVLSVTAELTYKCTDYYASNLERCLRWDDPDLAILWPLVNRLAPRISKKDAAGCSLNDAESYG